MLDHSDASVLPRSGCFMVVCVGFRDIPGSLMQTSFGNLANAPKPGPPPVILRLLFQAARVGSPDAGLKELAGHVLAAYETVLHALWRYRAGHEKLKWRVLGQLNKLKRARVEDRGNFLHQMIADPEHETRPVAANEKVGHGAAA